MVLRKLAVALLGVGVLLPGLSHALAIGDIRTKSALGEPYRGEVELSEIGDLTADEIKAGLATQEEFERLGIEKVYFLNELRFEVEVREGGKAILKISTLKPVSEPFLDFVVRVNWPGNTTMRSMTALLDPPTTQAYQAPVVKPVAPVVVKPVEQPVKAPEPRVVAEPKPVVEAKPAEVPAAKKPAEPKPAPVAQSRKEPTAPKAEAAPAVDSYRTKSSESLWAIALKVRPSKGVSVHQTMIAIQRANTDAFGNNNINALKTGQILRIPSESQIREISSAEAIQSVNDQNNAWKGLSAQSDKPLEAAQVNATAKPVAQAPAAAQPKPEMKLVAPQGGKTASATAGKDDAKKAADAAAAKKVAENQQKAAEAKKAAEKVGAEVKATEGKLKDNDAKLKMQDAKLAELQAKMKEQQAKEEAAKAEAAKKAEADKLAADKAKADAAKKEEAVAAEQKPEPVKPAEPAVAEAKKEAPKPVQPVAAPEAAEEGGMPLVPVLIGGVLALAGGVAAFLFKRRKDQKAEEEALAEIEELEDGPSETPSFSFDEDSSLDSNLDGLDLGGDETLLTEAAPAVDPLEEAEGYIAYGRYPQAIGFLSKAIAAAPERSDLRTKLLECYAATNDHEGFSALEAQFEEAGDLDALALAETLKASMAPAPALAAQVDDDGLIEFESSAAGDELPSLEDLELDFNQSISQSSTSLPVVGESALELDEGLDFNLDTAEPQAAVAATDDFGLDLGDLDLDAPATPSGAADDLSFAGDDLGGLDLDADFSLDEPAAAEPLAAVGEGDLDSLGGDLSFELDDVPTGESDAPLADAEISFDLGEVDLDGLEGDTTPAEQAATVSEDDLSFSLDDLDVAEVAPVSEVVSESAVEDDFASLDLDAGALDFEVESASAPVAVEPEAELTLDDLDADFSVGDEPELASEPLVDLDGAVSSELGDAAAEFDLALAEPEVITEDAVELESPVEESLEVVDAPLADDDFDFLADADENATKLDLAKAYIDMGDMEGARDILQEVLAEGSTDQQEEARGLMAQVG